MSISESALPGESQPSPYRVLLATLNQVIKDDAASLRSERRLIRELQRAYGSGAAASQQSRLSYHRLNARARLLVYGLMRGRTWERIEPKHGEATPVLRYAVQRAFKAAQDATRQQTGVTLDMPEALNVVLR